MFFLSDSLTCFFFFQAEDGIRDGHVTGVQTCALPIFSGADQLARLNRPKGELLDALQELARLAVQTRTGNRSRLKIGRASCRERVEIQLVALVVQTRKKTENRRREDARRRRGDMTGRL